VGSQRAFPKAVPCIEARGMKVGTTLGHRSRRTGRESIGQWSGKDRRPLLGHLGRTVPSRDRRAGLLVPIDWWVSSHQLSHCVWHGADSTCIVRFASSPAGPGAPTASRTLAPAGGCFMGQQDGFSPHVDPAPRRLFGASRLKTPCYEVACRSRRGRSRRGTKRPYKEG
jgi:hypothetical protein